MIVSFLVYKIVSLFVGVAFAYMGYRLFMAGIWGNSGDLDAQFGKNRLLLKKAAPGTFFALFGAIVIALTILKGFSADNVSQTDNPSIKKLSGHSKVELPNKPPF